MLRSGLWGGQSVVLRTPAASLFDLQISIALSWLLTVEGRTKTPVDLFRSDAKVELNFLLFLKDECFKFGYQVLDGS